MPWGTIWEYVIGFLSLVHRQWRRREGDWTYTVYVVFFTSGGPNFPLLLLVFRLPYSGVVKSTWANLSLRPSYVLLPPEVPRRTLRGRSFVVDSTPLVPVPPDVDRSLRLPVLRTSDRVRLVTGTFGFWRDETPGCYPLQCSLSSLLNMGSVSRTTPGGCSVFIGLLCPPLVFPHILLLLDLSHPLVLSRHSSRIPNIGPVDPGQDRDNERSIHWNPLESDGRISDPITRVSHFTT